MAYKKRVFIGFDYIEHFKNTIGEKLKQWIETNRAEAVFPLDRTPGGDLLNRIERMITDSDVTLWECSTLNPNVTFELGYAIGKRLPFFILYETSLEQRAPMPAVFKTQWGVWYASFDDLMKKLRPIMQRTFPKGTYDVQTNEPIGEPAGLSMDLNAIHVIIDHSSDYSMELRAINESWPNNRIETIKIEDLTDLSGLLSSVGSVAFCVIILNSVADETGSSAPSVNTLNALKMLALGIALGLGTDVLLLQQGQRDYSDVVGISKHWQSEKDLKGVMTNWNREKSSKAGTRSALDKKIGVPHFGKLIKRERLNDFISRSLFSKAVIVRTPSGYGKSCLVAQYISESNYPVIWYTLDNEKSEPTDFVRAIMAELNKINTNVGKELYSVISSFSKRELSEDNLTSYLLDEVKNAAAKVVLVLDDVHYATGTRLVSQIESLAKTPPDNLGLILLSREDLGDEFRGLDSKTTITLEKEALEFTKEELEDYISSIFGLSLARDQIEVLWQKSEGWIASISLLNSIIARKGKEAISEIIARLRGTDVKIYNYFADIVYDCFEEGIKDLLEKTSILDTITVPSASFLSGIPHQQMEITLRELEQKNSFLFNFENRPDAYRYHSLFREFLQKKYELAVGADGVIKSKGELSRFFLDQEDYFEAISFGLTGKNYISAANATKAIGHHVINEGLGNALLDWLKKIPQSFYVNDPKILILKGRAEEQAGMIDSARSSFNAAQSSMSSAGGSEGDALLLRFLIHQLDMLQHTDVGELCDESLAIMKEARRLKEDTVYFGAADSYFALWSERTAKEQKAGNIDPEAYEQIISQADSVLEELSESTISDKGIYRSQLLVNKAKAVHFISRIKAARAITQAEMTMITHVKPDKNRAEKAFNEFLQSNKTVAECFDEALAISRKMGLLVLEANSLAERAELASSNYQFMSMMMRTPPPGYMETIMSDFNRALEIYSKLGQSYGIAMVYNNVASTFLLLNDKTNRDKYAQLSLEISRRNSFGVLESKSLGILGMPTLEEMRLESIRQADETLDGKIPEKERGQLLETLVDLAGKFEGAERERRKSILILELQDMEEYHALQKNWCKHLEMFDTHSPLSKQPRIDETMVDAYLNEDEEAIKLYDSWKDDFGGERIAKFLYCRVVRVHSDGLEESVKSLSEKFIEKHCSSCRYRTT